MRWFFGVLIWGVSYNEVMNLDDFSYVENDRRYVKPDIALNEQNAFIDNLRNTQAQDTAQIQQNTRNLGTAVPSNLGGLGGGSGYFKARYQTPQTNSMVADLRAAAQSQALNTVMNNEIAKAKKLYQDAYRAANKRANGNGGNGSDYLDALSVLESNDDSSDPQVVKEIDINDASATNARAGKEKELQLLRRQLANVKTPMERTGEESGAWGNIAMFLNPVYGLGQAAIYYDERGKIQDKIKALEKELGYE